MHFPWGRVSCFYWGLPKTVSEFVQNTDTNYGGLKLLAYWFGGGGFLTGFFHIFGTLLYRFRRIWLRKMETPPPLFVKIMLPLRKIQKACVTFSLIAFPMTINNSKVLLTSKPATIFPGRALIFFPVLVSERELISFQVHVEWKHMCVSLLIRTNGIDQFIQKRDFRIFILYIVGV